ncbi:MAG: NAD(P)/FAD-dependent oxidoreductase [Dehalococcoidia bacterium]|nr:NAD(P)/FAD-dependent oxidoreductase [Dehalococcoidia bacterium]
MVSAKTLYDVIVIGGGPVGSQVAYRLAGMGYHIVVLERKTRLTDAACCTGIVSQECTTAFSIPDSVIYRWVNGAQLYSPSSKPLEIERTAPQVAILNRPAFNELWAEYAQTAGAEFLVGSEVRGIRKGENSVVIDVINRGNKIELQARVAVLTTGFGSQLVDGLGLGAAGDFVMGAQAEVETKADKVEVYFGNKIAPGFFAWLVPTVPGKALAGLLSRRHPPAYLRSFLARLSAEGKIVSADVPFTYGGVPLKPLPKTYGERLLVVGTAAGQVKPLTGGGIYFGLICADIAANTLHRCLGWDDLSNDKLAGYQRSWKRRLGRELRTGYLARRIYERLNDRQLDRIFGLMDSSGLIQELEDAGELSFDWHADVVSHIFSQRMFMTAMRSVKMPLNLRVRLRRDANT